MMKAILKFNLGDKLQASVRPIYNAESGIDLDW